MSEHVEWHDGTYLDVYVAEPLVGAGRHTTRSSGDADLPTFDDAVPLLPEPVWDGHDDAVACYWRAWELAFRNLRPADPGAGLVAPHLDAAFNGSLFLWDTVFATFFGRYGRRAFAFQRGLDNFYARQHADGFICRELRADGTDRFHRFDPSSTGPNLLMWAEHDYALATGDTSRLASVLPAVAAYHRWLRRYRTWPDGTYWTNGWGSGMDNLPRAGSQPSTPFVHGHLGWVDACLQQILSARLLATVAAAHPAEGVDPAEFVAEGDQLTEVVNRSFWNEALGVYVDRRADGTPSDVVTVATFWALLAGVASPERSQRLLKALDDPATFRRPHRVPALSAGDPHYQPTGGYWRGGVWPPTTYMAVRAAGAAGADELAAAIASNHVENVTATFTETATLWECYAPEHARPGDDARPDFVGWSALGPIAGLLEYTLGVRTQGADRVLWTVGLTEAHGVRRMPVGAAASVDLMCAGRGSAREEPTVSVTASHPLTVEVRWQGGSKVIETGRQPVVGC